MKQFFAPISKINKKTREVHGILALEVRDKEGEIMDYNDSKQYFIEWSDGIKKASGGKSVGNLREMHQPIVAGKFTAMSFDDENKRIPVIAKVSNDKSWQKVLDGELNGFSIYGDPIYRKRDKVNKAIRYAVKPVEGSLVDNPAMYGADFTLIKEDGEEIVAKFAGEKKPFQYWSCNKVCDLFHKTEEEASSCAGIVEKSFNNEEEELDTDYTNEAVPISKGMYDVSSLASQISSLKWIDPGDANKKKFTSAVKSLYDVLGKMVKTEKESFESSLSGLAEAAQTVKTAGLELLGENMKLKVKKSQVADTENDELEIDVDDIMPELETRLAKSLGKTIAKTVGTAVGPIVKAAIDEALEEQNETISLLNKAVLKMAGTAKGSNVVTKAADRKSLKNNHENDDEKPEPKKIEKTSDTSELLSVMKTALKKSVPYGSPTPDEDEEENEDNESENEE